jgi:DNA-binding NarL/FixJ family response regulator
MNKKSAMIIDGDQEGVVRFRRLLSEKNIDLIGWSGSGSGWIAEWQKLKPDLVIVTYVLPRRDGLHCLEQIQAHAPDTPVIFTHSFSGPAALDIESKAYARKASAVYAKYLSDKRFLLALDQIIVKIDKNKSMKRSSFSKGD